jgi:hypothetical protein
MSSVPQAFLGAFLGGNSDTSSGPGEERGGLAEVLGLPASDEAVDARLQQIARLVHP